MHGAGRVNIANCNKNHNEKCLFLEANISSLKYNTDIILKVPQISFQHKKEKNPFTQRKGNEKHFEAAFYSSAPICIYITLS